MIVFECLNSTKLISRKFKDSPHKLSYLTNTDERKLVTATPQQTFSRNFLLTKNFEPSHWNRQFDKLFSFIILPTSKPSEEFSRNFLTDVLTRYSSHLSRQMETFDQPKTHLSRKWHFILLEFIALYSFGRVNSLFLEKY